MNNTQLRTAFIIWTLSVGMLGTTFSWLAPSSLHAILGSAIIWVGTIPIFLELQGYKNCKYKLFGITGVIIAVSYGLPAFIVGMLFPHDIPIEYFGREFESTATLMSVEALTLALFGIVLFVTSFHLSQYGLSKYLPFYNNSKIKSLRTTQILAWGLLLFSIAFYVSPIIRALPSITQLGQPAAMISFTLFLTAMCRREISLFHGLIAAAGFSVIFFMLIVAASLPPILLFGMIGFFVLWREFKRLPIWLLVVGGLLVVVTMQTLYISRTQIWGDGPYANASALIKAKVVLAVATYRLTGSSLIELKNIDLHTESAHSAEGGLARRLSQRLSHLPHLSVGLEAIDNGVPLLGGQTYTPIFTSFIPRVIWPNKPREEVGRKFGADYWDEKNQNMSMNLPWMPELLINFGKVGSVLGMAAYGLLFSALYSIFNSVQSTPLFSAVGLVVLLPFVYPESNFTLMTGSILPLIIAMWLYFTIGERLILVIQERVQSSRLK